MHQTNLLFFLPTEHCLPGTTMLGQPLDTKVLGKTNVDMENLTSYLRNLGQSE